MSQSNLQLIPAPTSTSPKPGLGQLLRLDEAGMPGKTLGEFYSAIADKVGTAVSDVARRFGHGPGAAFDKIEKFFHQESCQECSVQQLHTEKRIPQDVLSACNELVKFAFRSQTPQTQYSTFKKLVFLSTQYPGLKVFFAQSDYMDGLLIPENSMHTNISGMWDRPDNAMCDGQWHFFCELSAACLADTEIFTLIDGHPPSALSSTTAYVSGLSFIEHLLNVSMYDSRAPFSCHIAIRYLGTILNQKNFWNQLRLEYSNQEDLDGGHSTQLYSGIVDKLLKRAESLLQDLDIDQSEELLTKPQSPPRALWLDAEGVDTYCQAILSGLQSLFLERPSTEACVTDDRALWAHSLSSVVQLLRQEKSKTLLPKSREMAVNNTYKEYLHFDLEDRDVEVEYSAERDPNAGAASNIPAVPESPSPGLKYGVSRVAIGKGSTSVIRLAHKWDRNEEKLYAVKEFAKRRRNETEKEYIKKLNAEYCIGAALHHPNVVETIDLFQDEQGKWCEVMEFCPGGDLHAAIKKGGMSPSEVQCCFKQVLQGVGYLHSQGVAHRDIRPENLFFDAAGCLKIGDYGAATVFRLPWENTIHMSTGSFAGEPHVAPEQFLGKPYDARLVDIWACGILYHWMYLRQPPWRETGQRDRIYAAYASAAAKAPAIPGPPASSLSAFPPPINKLSPPACRLLIRNMLEPDPTARPSIDEVLRSAWLEGVEVCWTVGEGATHVHVNAAIET